MRMKLMFNFQHQISFSFKLTAKDVFSDFIIILYKQLIFVNFDRKSDWKKLIVIEKNRITGNNAYLNVYKNQINLTKMQNFDLLIVFHLVQKITFLYA